MTIGLDLIDLLKEVRLANHKISHAHALLWLISHRAKEEATYSKNGRSFALLQGEVMSSYDEMSRLWGWDIKTVRSFIAKLETGGYLTVKTCYYGVILTFPLIKQIEIEMKDDTSNGDSPADVEEASNPSQVTKRETVREPGLFDQVNDKGMS